MMRFYNQPHRFYCGVGLHARCMYLCVLDQAGQVVVHRDYPADAHAFLDAVAPFRDGLVVAVTPRYGSISRARRGNHLTPGPIFAAVEALATAPWPTPQMCLVQPAYYLLGDDTRVATTNQETCRCSDERKPALSS